MRSLAIRRVELEGFPAEHAFTLRHGGTSTGAYASLNLGDAVGDDPACVAANRRAVTSELELEAGQVHLLRQVHGDRIVTVDAERDVADGLPEADAHVSADPRAALVISVADCLPILFFDSRTGAAAAAHCGWRGTSLRLAGKVIDTLGACYGTRAADVSVAIGPGIGGECYQVGEEIVERFVAAGFPLDVAKPDDAGRFRLDLARANRIGLAEAGVHPERIFVDASCTHCDSQNFFSYRRDGVTGRHWAVVRPATVGTMRHAASTRDHAAPPRARRLPLGPKTDA